ncbi:hypothetical protein [Streptomyces albidoflavus]|uniref:hypothetical protein n=1 Tax=Streptomyces albidoflavus TaxID=1886 RepID=UPI00101E236F|nr:hypothetical protein [Streptomyces albidoflavus]RZD80245.1 hypothetical protein C0Q63_27210 [Streptomyces albidoflavus]
MTRPDSPEAAWTVHPVGLLRSAGLPAAWLTGLTPAEPVEADALLTAAHESMVAVRRRCVAELRAARGSGAAPQAAVKAASRALDRVRVLPAAAHPALTGRTRAAWDEAVRHRDARAVAFDAAWRDATDAEHAALVLRVADPAVAEVLLMNSRGAHTALTREATAGTLRPANRRVAYRYLQRLCGKAESGGHGGPVNLIHLGTAPPSHAGGSDGHALVHHDPLLGRVEATVLGDGRAATRRTFLSHWAAQALVDTLVGQEGGEALLRPCRVIADGPAELPAPGTPAATLLAGADGSRSLPALAELLGVGLREVRELAAGLAERGLLTLDRRLPGYLGDPASGLASVAAEAPPGKRGPVLAVAGAAEGLATVPASRRAEALDALEAAFTERTGHPARRGEGRFYADRFVLSEEAYGNVRAAVVGPEGTRALMRRLETALDLLASRAVAHRLAGQKLIRRALRRSGTDSLPAGAVRRLALPPAAEKRMPEAFAALLDGAGICAELTRADLEGAGLLRPDLDAWPLFGAADLMPVGDPAPPGAGELVLSELHHIWPPLGRPWRGLFSDEEWQLDALRTRLADALAPARPLIQQIARDQKGTDSSPLGHHLLCLDRMEQGPGAGPVALDELVVRERADGFLGLHSPSRGEDYWLCPDYDDNGLDVGGLAQCALPAMELPEIRLGEHTPRIVVDGVVLQRRRWDPPPGSVPVASTGRVTATEWRTVRQWAGRLGMPRYLFFRTDAAPKPMWLDLASPLSVTNLSHALRGARSVTFHEMLPHPDALWLRTPGGTLVSEIRTLILRGTDPTRGSTWNS